MGKTEGLAVVWGNDSFGSDCCILVCIGKSGERREIALDLGVGGVGGESGIKSSAKAFLALSAMSWVLNGL